MDVQEDRIANARLLIEIRGPVTPARSAVVRMRWEASG